MSYEFQGRTRDRMEAESARRPRRSRREPEAGADAGPEPRQPIHGFAGGTGLLFLVVGIGGFIPGVTSRYDELAFAGPDSGARLVGLLQVSGLQNIVHLLLAVGLIAAARAAWSRTYLLGGGVALLAIGLFGAMTDRESDGNILAVNAADNVLHLGLALAMIGLGLLGVRLSRGRPAPGS